MIKGVDLEILRTSALKKLRITSKVIVWESSFRRFRLRYLESLRKDKINSVSCRRGMQERTFATRCVGQPSRKTSANSRAVHLAAGPIKPKDILLNDKRCGKSSSLRSLKPWIDGPLYGEILETAGCCIKSAGKVCIFWQWGNEVAPIRSAVDKHGEEVDFEA